MLRDYVRLVGVLAGLVVASFSRTLAVLFGLLVFGVQVRMLPWGLVLTRPTGGFADVAGADGRWDLVRSLQGVLFTGRKVTAVHQGDRYTVCPSRQRGLQVELRAHLYAGSFRRVLNKG